MKYPWTPESFSSLVPSQSGEFFRDLPFFDQPFFSPPLFFPSYSRELTAVRLQLFSSFFRLWLRVKASALSTNYSLEFSYVPCGRLLGDCRPPMVSRSSSSSPSSSVSSWWAFPDLSSFLAPMPRITLRCSLFFLFSAFLFSLSDPSFFQGSLDAFDIPTPPPGSYSDTFDDSHTR